MTKKKTSSKMAWDILEENGLNERGDEKPWENVERAKNKRRAAKAIRASDAQAREESATATLEKYAGFYAEDAKESFDYGEAGAEKIRAELDPVHEKWQTAFKAKLQKSGGKTTARGFASQHGSGKSPETVRQHISKEKALLELARECGEPFETELQRYRDRYRTRK